MKNLHRYVGHLVFLHPKNFKKLVESAQKKGIFLENIFLVSAVKKANKGKKLVCYSAGLCVVVSPSEITLA